MELFRKSLERDVAVIAEIGVNHEGDLEAAKRLVRLAAEAGADAVKFQTYTPKRFASANDPERLARVTRFSLGEGALKQLREVADGAGIALFSTAVTEDTVPMLAAMFDCIKIASGDLTFEPVIRAAARSGRVVILSTGGGTVDEVDRAVAWVADEVGSERLGERLVLMHCVASYPVPPEQANVRSVPFLAQRYPALTVGYSNHVIGTEACLAAVALGAKVVEVHFTDCKTGRSFRDHELSLEAGDLKEMVRQIGIISQALGQFDKRPQLCEEPLLPIIRKGVVAARDLKAGHRLESGDLMYARPATEFPASELPRLVGRVLTQDVAEGCLIERAAVKP
ncbi:MAG: N-acetylneuraminate synthase family protein [Pseudomonadota bacterium]